MKYKKLYEDKQHGLEGFPIAVYSLDDTCIDYIMPVHWHNEFEILRVISGSFDLYINSELYRLNAGEYAFINCKCLHHGEPDKACVYEIIDLDLQLLRTKFNNIFQKYLEPLQSGITVTVTSLPKENTFITEEVNKLFDTLKSRDNLFEIKTVTSLFTIFDFLFSNNYINENCLSKKYLKQSAVVANLMHLIDEKYTDTITLAILAEKAQLSQNYICKIFKESTGKTPIEYVNEIRIKNVCHELQSGTKSIAQIAADNGYKDMSYFCKVFKKHTGITAEKYANKYGVE